jgi:hypothetical protein
MVINLKLVISSSRAAARLQIPVQSLAPGATYEDAVRAWFNPIAVPGVTGFHPDDIGVLTKRPAIGWVIGIRDREVDGFSREIFLPSSNAWLLHVAASSLEDVNNLVRDLHYATVVEDADMLVSAALSEIPYVRGSLATLLRFDCPAGG